MKHIETRKDEIRYKTLDTSKMLNKYLASQVVKKWTEDFKDEDTGEIVSIERSQVLYDKGTLINADMLQKITFDIQAGEITEPIEVSNQNRDGFELEHTAIEPWTAKVCVGEKNIKFLMYASTVDNALEILRDYVELNYTGGFTITEIKEFSRCIILTDTLTSEKMEGEDIDKEYLSGNIDFDTYIESREKDKSDEVESESTRDEGKKFYQLDIFVQFTDTDNTEGEYNAQFVVHTFDTDRALLIIKAYLTAREHKLAKEYEEKGSKYDTKSFHLIIEKAAPIPIGKYIPKQFTLAYTGE